MSQPNNLNLPPLLVIIGVMVFGFLTASSVYFYLKSRDTTKKNSSEKVTFSADQTAQQKEPEVNIKVDAQTKPAEPKNRLSYPANVYAVQPKESLFAIGTKLGMTFQLIKQANNIKDENLIQAGTVLAIPKLSTTTDYYRVNFLVNQEKASELNKELRDAAESEWFDPIQVAKKNASPYFGVSELDTYRLVEADYSNGTALVEAKLEEKVNYIGLMQPKTKGQKGLWAIVYIESRDE